MMSCLGPMGRSTDADELLEGGARVNIVLCRTGAPGTRYASSRFTRAGISPGISPVGADSVSTRPRRDHRVACASAYDSIVAARLASSVVDGSNTPLCRNIRRCVGADSDDVCGLRSLDATWDWFLW